MSADAVHDRYQRAWKRYVEAVYDFATSGGGEARSEDALRAVLAPDFAAERRRQESKLIDTLLEDDIEISGDGVEASIMRVAALFEVVDRVLAQAEWTPDQVAAFADRGVKLIGKLDPGHDLRSTSHAGREFARRVDRLVGGLPGEVGEVRNRMPFGSTNATGLLMNVRSLRPQGERLDAEIRQATIDRYALEVMAHEPDFVALNEVVRPTEAARLSSTPAATPDALQELATATGMQVVWIPTLWLSDDRKQREPIDGGSSRLDGFEYGNAFLVAPGINIVSEQSHDLPATGTFVARRPQMHELRRTLDVVLAKDGIEFQATAIHYSPPQRRAVRGALSPESDALASVNENWAQAGRTARIVNAYKGPRIVVGDANDTASFAQVLSARGFDVPTVGPTRSGREIDRLALSEGVELRGQPSLPSTPSDHRAVAFKVRVAAASVERNLRAQIAPAFAP